ncbi:MAG: 5-methyltetrahydropteroyltriglutamate--homocysteine methyltransferase, partial [Actinomycetota bacterium]|nr:5-methyltetrahydropteroyltriglutamate--homocysteine methyltransferase [Actinomycetota bacterium]
MGNVDLTGPGLWTTSVGSFPKPDYITKARSQYARKEISREELHKLEEQATREWIEFQDSIDTDLVVDGEQYRGDMVAYFAEELPGLEMGGLVRSYGNRYYRKPIAMGPIGRDKPMTVDWWKFAQSLTEKPVKGMLTGPYTIMDWSFNEHYATRRDFTLALAKVIRDEALDLEKAGAKYIQIDEPAAS